MNHARSRAAGQTNASGNEAQQAQGGTPWGTDGRK
jgi:hypothetical protein